LIEDNYVDAKLNGSKTQYEFDTLKVRLNSIQMKYKNLYRQIGAANDAYKIATSNFDKELAQKKQII